MKTFYVRIFPDDETTEMTYPVVTHAFWEANNTVLTLCLPDGKHEHWLRERIRHYTVTENAADNVPAVHPHPTTRYLDDPRHT